jgi:hypothetical protein
MSLDDIILSERSQFPKDKFCLILQIGGSWRVQFISTESRMVVSQKSFREMRSEC